MIFVTVGHQMPFDRLVRTVDKWAGESHAEGVFAQIGETSFRPRFMEYVDSLAPAAFREKVEACSVMVSHAGMGSIITALEFGKPILVMPRRGDLGETRNDHQVATAEHFAGHGGVSVAFDEWALGKKLAAVESAAVGARVSKWASQELLNALKKFVSCDADGGVLF